MKLQVKGAWFVDKSNRKVLLRGVNLGGSSKVPFNPNGATHIKTDFFDHRDVSFIGRPFPLEEADEHFSRITHWGFNCLRLLTTWEAIEHTGPGHYDQNYLDYFAKIVEIAGEHGLYVIIDPHQDVWSRMTGGDGAPGWTFEKVGLDFTKFSAADAAITMQAHYPDSYPRMIWSANYSRFATASMFTLFFGGKQFAENVMVKGKNVQDYLQQHFTASMVQVAERIQDFDHVLGFGPLNEPSKGFIGYPNLRSLPEFKIPSLMYTPLDIMYAAAGNRVEVPEYKLRWFRVRPVSTGILNPNEISVWKDGAEDFWQEHGVWENSENGPITKQPQYFAHNPQGNKVDFFRDYMVPFIEDYTRQIREVMPEATIFLEGDIVALSEPITWTENNPSNVVNASHWYDGFTLFTKRFRSWLNIDTQTMRPVLFKRNIRKAFYRQLLRNKVESEQIQGGIPTLIGEFGIPFDMNNAKAYKTSNFKMQIEALSLYHDIFDELQLHSTLWNYTSDNNNKWGDLWNKEDLSIFSRDQQTDQNSLDSGGRAIEGFSRPYPVRIHGDPIEWKFDGIHRRFLLKYDAKGSDEIATEIFIPHVHFPQDIEVSSSHGWYEFDESTRILSIYVPMPTYNVVTVEAT